MRILIAEDDAISRRVLESTLINWGYEVTVTCDGAEACEQVAKEDVPLMAILDIMMPEYDGIEVCRRIRRISQEIPTYIILLTGKTSKEDVVAGLNAGADDYVTKPFDRDELLARVRVGERMIGLQRSLAEHLRELEEALSHIKQLQGILPICSYCKSIRDGQNYWQQVESYIGNHTDAQFSHSVCPTCYTNVVEPEIERMRNSMNRAAKGNL